MSRHWKREHGPDYDVPIDVLQLVQRELAHDLSWHNDMCPCFGTDTAHLWVEHRDIEQREVVKQRYAVAIAKDGENDEYVLLTDDVNLAIRTYLDLIHGR